MQAVRLWLLPVLGLAASPAVRAQGQEGLERLDLRREVRVAATHATEGEEFRIENAVDGDPETKWVGEGHPLTWQPANIVIELPEPRVLTRLVIVSAHHRERLALKDLEVYGWGREGWAGTKPLAAARAREVRTAVDLRPARTRRLRLRLRDTWRDDHAFPRIHELELYAARGDPPAPALDDGPVPGETPSERLFVERALGRKIVLPAGPFDPEKGYLHYAQRFLDTFLEHGADRYGPEPSPLWASILDLETRRIPEATPANAPGQRLGDRAARGGNLFHHVMVLLACDLASEITGDGKYRGAATAALEFFLRRCPQPTGLWPWGEHAYWDFFEEAPAHHTHEHLGGVPRAFWERAWALRPAAVEGEGRGLLNHVVNLETFDFDRHADLFKPLPVPRPRGLGFLDFPRHAGFYLGLWSYLHARTGEASYLEWSRGIAEHHWRTRDPVSGLPPGCSQGARAQSVSVESALSLSVSLLEAAETLSGGPEGPGREAAARFRAMAGSYLDAILSLRHRPEEGAFLVSFPAGSAPAAAEGTYGSPYRYVYGGGFSADDAVLLLAAYRRVKDERALGLGKGFGDYYARGEPPPAWEVVRAHVYASLIGLFLELYELSGEPRYLAEAERHGRLAIERLFYRALFRAGTGVDHFEADLGVGNLVYNLLWLHARKEGLEVEIPANHFNR